MTTNREILYKTLPAMDNKPMTKPLAPEKQKIDAAVVRRTIRINADADGALPTRIMLIQTGEWPDSVKGNLSISVSDLQEMKRNYDNGIARPGMGLGLPIDFSHNEWMEAAGWIEALDVETDQANPNQGALYATVEWTTDGATALTGGMYKCISPSFYPAGRGGWQDPENLNVSIDNVLVGAGLTNIPFFKGLTAVKASSLSDIDDDDNMIFINKSESAKGKANMSTLDEIRVKEVTALTDADKTEIKAHAEDLSADEKTKFAAVLADNKPAPTNNEPQLSDEDRKLLADIKSGKSKIVSADTPKIDADTQARLDRLQDTADKYEKEKAEQIVTAHIERGAIKPDQADRWTSRLLNASATDRTELETDLAALPSNEELGKEKGNDVDPGTFADARTELATKAGELVKAASAEGKTLDYIEAQKQVLASDPQLAERNRKENKIA